MTSSQISVALFNALLAAPFSIFAAYANLRAAKKLEFFALVAFLTSVLGCCFNIYSSASFPAYASFNAGVLFLIVFIGACASVRVGDTSSFSYIAAGLLIATAALNICFVVNGTSWLVSTITLTLFTVFSALASLHAGKLGFYTFTGVALTFVGAYINILVTA